MVVFCTVNEKYTWTQAFLGQWFQSEIFFNADMLKDVPKQRIKMT